MNRTTLAAVALAVTATAVTATTTADATDRWVRVTHTQPAAHPDPPPGGGKWPVTQKILDGYPHECHHDFHAGDKTNEHITESKDHKVLTRIDTVTDYTRCHTTRYAPYQYVWYRWDEVMGAYTPYNLNFVCHWFTRINLDYRYHGLTFKGDPKVLHYRMGLPCVKGEMGKTKTQQFPFGHGYVLIAKHDPDRPGDDVVPYNIAVTETVKQQRTDPLQPHVGVLHGNGQDGA